jgi:2-polyprenyl-6-methoxyphenol hydroxylase-like FAD-dependent oxidoreductase
MTIDAEDLRRLLASDLPDAVLALTEGRLDVVLADDLDADDYRGALLVLSREELLARSGGLPVTRSRSAHDSVDSRYPSDSVYFDSVCQVTSDSWSDGRVVLVGDAAWCVSFFGGHGASLAVGGADLLATELEREPGDITAALQRWETKLRPDIDRLQAMGRRNTAVHAPGSRFHVFARNLVMRMVSFPPVRRIVQRHFQLDGRR